MPMARVTLGCDADGGSAVKRQLGHLVKGGVHVLRRAVGRAQRQVNGHTAGVHGVHARGRQQISDFLIRVEF